MNGLNGSTMEENMSAASSPESSHSSTGRGTPPGERLPNKKHDDTHTNSNSEDRTMESDGSPESSKEPDNDLESEVAKPADKVSAGELPESSEMDTSDIVHSTTNLGETENSNDSNSDNSEPNHAERAKSLENGNKNDSNLETESINSSRVKDKSDRGTEDESEDGAVVHEIQTDSDGEDDEVKAVTMNDDDSDEVDSDDETSEEEDSDVEFDEVTSGMDEDPVSINSDSDPEVISGDVISGDIPTKNNKSPRKNVDSGEVLLVEDLSNQGEDKAKSDELKNGKQKPVIHEILSDNEDCILPDMKEASDKKAQAQAQEVENRRRSSRNVGRQSYKETDEEAAENGGAESDLEEIVKDPLDHKAVMNNSNVTNDTKKLFEFASKQIGKASSINLVPRQQKKPNIKIVDPVSIMASLPPQISKTPFSMLPLNASSQALYQSIASRGTTVTPMSAKTANTTNAIAPTPPIILPSLTDDMFVVEAPSFIVPYVYEKPSMKPFKEFVDTLGKELEEQRLKKEQAKMEKEKELQEKLEKERKEKGIEEPPKPAEPEENKMECEESKNSEEMDVDQDDSVKDPDKKSQKRKRKKGDDDDASWDGESSSDSDDENMSDDDRPKTVIIKDKEDDSIVEIKDAVAVDPSLDPKVGVKSDSYFDNSLGKFFINIGGNLVQEYVQNDLLRQQKRKLHAEKRYATGNSKATETAISSLMKNLEFSKENNAPYKFQQKKCEFCSFKTESALAMAHHMETPHMKNNVYKCNFCAFEIRSPHDILYHMEAEHNTRGRLERAPAYHQCANCPFEDNGKGKLARHLIACAKKFKPDYNLSPPVEWEPPAKIPKVTRVRQHGMMNSYQAAFAKAQPSNARLPHPTQLPMAGIVGQMYRGRGKPPFVPTGKPVHGAPLVREGVMYRSNTPQQVLSQANYQLLPGQAAAKAGLQIPKALQHQPSISITPLPRSAQPPPLAPIAAAASAAAALGSAGKSSFVICEICDGYIKDLEQLRNHMQWIHKVKIHPKMIYNRPPLNCQKCQFRFFTDQGLERHLLGSHGLVTSSMQEAANKGKDAGRCPVCGRVYQWKLLNHVARDHSMTLKPAHLSYKCTVCTATFGMYKQFENHVYSAHSVVVKREIDKTKGAVAAAGSSKTQKVNDEAKNAGPKANAK